MSTSTIANTVVSKQECQHTGLGIRYERRVFKCNMIPTFNVFDISVPQAYQLGIEALRVCLLYQWLANEGKTSIRLLLLQQAAECVKLHRGTTTHDDPMHPWILMDFELPASSLEPGQPFPAEPEPGDEPDGIHATRGTLVNLHGVTRIFRQFLQGFKPKCRVAHERE
ncbi:MCM DNA helicase complex subunit [Marasmius sp. AFHP31]|nr:MCM DNA helicase complex subunit [Marasmius sp. AFHP31]